MPTRFADTSHTPDVFPGIENVPNTSLYLMGCRNVSQFCSTARSLLDPDRYCPFCIQERTRRGRAAIHSTRSWDLIHNDYQHKHTARMLLIVPKHHSCNIGTMKASDWEEVGVLLNYCQEKLGIHDGGIVWRFGGPRHNVGTIEHLHINIIEPIPGSEYRPPLAKNNSEHEEDYERFLKFRNSLLEKGGYGWLMSAEGVAETQPAFA